MSGSSSKGTATTRSVRASIATGKTDGMRGDISDRVFSANLPEAALYADCMATLAVMRHAWTAEDQRMTLSVLVCTLCNE